MPSSTACRRGRLMTDAVRRHRQWPAARRAWRPAYDWPARKRCLRHRGSGLQRLTLTVGTPFRDALSSFLFCNSDVVGTREITTSLNVSHAAKADYPGKIRHSYPHPGVPMRTIYAAVDLIIQVARRRPGPSPYGAVPITDRSYWSGHASDFFHRPRWRYPAPATASPTYRSVLARADGETACKTSASFRLKRNDIVSIRPRPTV